MVAAIYSRRSNDQPGVSAAETSTARQVERARAFATRQGWHVADEHVYVDDGISGAEFSARPGFMRLLNAVTPRAPFQTLIVSELSRLGREQLETGYAVKQLAQAGVRIYSYLDGREVVLDSAVDKFLMSAVNFAAEIEREKARVRTADAMVRKARAGHATGAACYGYRNVDVIGADGKRSHVMREIDPAAADVIRRIFRWCADGYGIKAIAKRLNDAGAPSPRAQRGRSQSWAPSSVRAVLHRPLYHGEVRWNATRKRDHWGQRRQTGRPEADWIRVPAPSLQIVPDDVWHAAHARLDASRVLYLRSTKGRSFGRPAVGSPSPYLLTNLAACGRCGGPLRVCTRSHGSTRAKLYGCAHYHDRGRAICTNGADIPMADADGIVLEALLDDLLTPAVIQDAVDEALDLVCGRTSDDKLRVLEAELGKVARERDRLVAAIAAGGELAGLVDALTTRERRLTALEGDRRAIVARQRTQPTDTARVRAELTALAGQWRQVLTRKPEHARPVLSRLLVGRVTFSPIERRRWKMTGTGTLAGLFSRDVLSVGDTSPTGLDTGGQHLLARELWA